MCAGHGPLTGRCVRADRHLSDQGELPQVCEIQSWCPVEDDRRILGKTRWESKLIDWSNFIIGEIDSFIKKEGSL